MFYITFHRYFVAHLFALANSKLSLVSFYCLLTNCKTKTKAKMREGEGGRGSRRGGQTVRVREKNCLMRHY